jgi:DNA-directed RNA polymerase beta' subunit
MENVQILFKPKEGKLKQMYPELNSNKKFKDLSGEELLFVWYYACKSSPIDPSLPDALRANTAAAESIKRDKAKREKFSNLDFPERIKEAIEEMEKYNPDVRMVAKRIIQNSFNMLEKMSNTSIDQFETVEDDGKGNSIKKIDWSGRKQFVDTVAKIADTMPALIAQMEQGYGIVDEKGENASEKIIDIYHSRKEE